MKASQKSASCGTFILAGGGEARSGGKTYTDRIVRLDDTSPEACARR